MYAGIVMCPARRTGRSEKYTVCGDTFTRRSVLSSAFRPSATCTNISCTLRSCAAAGGSHAASGAATAAVVAAVKKLRLGFMGLAFDSIIEWSYFGNMNCTCRRSCQLAPSSGCTTL